MKQESEGGNPRCQLSIGAKTEVKPQFWVSKIPSIQNAHTPHVFPWFRTVCNILTIRYMVELLLAFNWMFYVHKPFGDLHFGVKPAEILMIWLAQNPPTKYDKAEKWYLLLSEGVCPECAKKKNYGKAQMKAWTTVKEQRTQELS